MRNTRHTYEWWEKFWESRIHTFGKPREELLNLAEAYYSNKKYKQLTAIDIGSGDGRYALPLAKIGYSTTALEITKSGCDLIRKKCFDDDIDISIIQSGLLNYTAQVNFNLVFSSGLLEEIHPDLQSKAVHCIKSLCREGGLLILKYCLEISERGQTVNEGFIPPYFINDDEWKIIRIVRDPKVRRSIANLKFENKIRTETIVAKRVNASTIF